MAKKKDTTVLNPLNDEQVGILRKGIEAAEKFDERARQATADKRNEIDKLAGTMEPLGYEKSDIVALLGRRRKDLDKVITSDLRVHKLEVFLGMATADLFEDAAAQMQGATTAAEATDASLAAGNAVAKDGKKGKLSLAKPPAPGTPATPPVHPDNNDTARRVQDEGRAVFARGGGEEACKYAKGSRDYVLWLQGWDSANDEFMADQKELAGEMAPKAPASDTPAAAQPKAPPRGQDYLRAVGAEI